MVPSRVPLFQFVITRLSFSTRSATRTAMLLRAATSPARLAVWIASTATGITMARNSIAAITSASVNAAQDFLAAGVVNFITLMVACLDQPARKPRTVRQLQRLWAAFINRPVRQELDRRQILKRHRRSRAHGAGHHNLQR